MAKNKTQNKQNRIAEQKAIMESGRKQLKAIKIGVTTLGVALLVLIAYVSMAPVLKYLLTIAGAALVYVGALAIKDMDQKDIMKSVTELTNDKEFMKRVSKIMK